MVLEWIWLSCLHVASSFIGHVMDFDRMMIGNITKGCRLLFWFATARTIWFFRNNIIFNGGICDVFDVVSIAKPVSWDWISIRFKGVFIYDKIYWLWIPLSIVLDSAFGVFSTFFYYRLSILYAPVNTLLLIKKCEQCRLILF